MWVLSATTFTGIAVLLLGTLVWVNYPQTGHGTTNVPRSLVIAGTILTIGGAVMWLRASA